MLILLKTSLCGTDFPRISRIIEWKKIKAQEFYLSGFISGQIFL